MTLFDQLKQSLESRDPITFHDDREFVTGVEDQCLAAVLVPVTDRPEPGVILTQRPLWLRRHAGQVAFPGGRMEKEDPDLTATALREAQEEIGLCPADVRIVGHGASYVSASGFNVTPVLGVIPPDIAFHPDPGEVADIFEVPLDFLLHPENSSRLEGEWNGIRREYFEIAWQDRRIWGLTAGILHNLSRQLQWMSE